MVGPLYWSYIKALALAIINLEPSFLNHGYMFGELQIGVCGSRRRKKDERGRWFGLGTVIQEVFRCKCYCKSLNEFFLNNYSFYWFFFVYFIFRCSLVFLIGWELLLTCASIKAILVDSL